MADFKEPALNLNLNQSSGRLKRLCTSILARRHKLFENHDDVGNRSQLLENHEGYSSCRVSSIVSLDDLQSEEVCLN